MKTGFYFNQENIKIAKENIETYAWAEKQYEQMIEEADQLLKIPDQVLYDCIIQMKDETFAYGISGCPHCQKPFPLFPDEQRGMFSSIMEWENKRITCPSCQMVFPNEQYPDEGLGLEIGSKGYYLIGMWNFYYGGELIGGVRNHEGLVSKLTYLFMLTKDEAYAKKAIVILDAFAAIFPDTIGPRDFTAFNSDYLIGRVHLLTSIVHRIKVPLAAAYDWLYHTSLLNEQSPALQLLDQTGTIRENIEAMLNDYMLSEPGGPEYDLTDGNLTNLQNHESDGVRAMLAVGLVLGQDEYCTWGKQALEAYFYNTIGRDGVYYEGSFGYALFTATVFLDIALLVRSASTAEELAEADPFAHQRLFTFCVENPIKMLCQGHLPAYGNWGRDTKTTTSPDLSVLTDVYRAALYFYQFSTDVMIREKAEEKLIELYSSVEGELGMKGIDLFFAHGPQKERVYQLPKQSTFFGQAGLGILRDQNDSTVLMRIGQNNTHSHDDVLGINYYAKGKEITADIGYGIFATNGHFGWNTKAIAHHTVVVNEDERLSEKQMYKPYAGGEWTCIYEENDLHVMEGDARELYEIDRYQRMVGLVPVAEELSYVIDFFQVSGAKTSDYSLHAFHEPSQMKVKNAEVLEESNVWTLGGLRHPDAYYNEKGKSFGERLTTGETFTEILADEGAQGWTPKINNGYGYIHHLQEYVVKDSVLQVDWLSEQGYRFQWAGMIHPGHRIFTGLGPSLEGEQQHPFLILRNEKEENCFVSMFYTTQQGESQSLTMEKIPVDQKGCYAVAIVLPNGVRDCWFYADQTKKVTVELPFGSWEIEGRVAMIRLDKEGELLKSACIDAQKITYKQKVIEKKRRVSCTILEVKVAEQVLIAEGELPNEKPKYMSLKPAQGTNRSLYPIKSVEQIDTHIKVVLAESLILSKGKVNRRIGNRLVSTYPLPLGWVEGREGSPFNGKKIIGELGGKAVIKKVLGLKEIEVDMIQPFVEGEVFSIIDVQENDQFQWV